MNKQERTETMFLWGFLCGCVPGIVLCLLRRRRTATALRPGICRRKHTAEWQKTRNFLYYDGTDMPVVKEGKHAGK